MYNVIFVNSTFWGGGNMGAPTHLAFSAEWVNIKKHTAEYPQFPLVNTNSVGPLTKFVSIQMCDTF